MIEHEYCHQLVFVNHLMVMRTGMVVLVLQEYY